jgi:hypothetical protein
MDADVVKVLSDPLSSLHIYRNLQYTEIEITGISEISEIPVRLQ